MLVQCAITWARHQDEAQDTLNDELDSNLLQFVTQVPRGRRYMAVAGAEPALVDVGAYIHDAVVAGRAGRHIGDLEERREDEESTQHEKFCGQGDLPMLRFWSNHRSDFQKSSRVVDQIEAAA